jgi:two-component system sensor histidine kinase/response regulator
METDSADLINQLQSNLRRLETALGAIADAIVWIGENQQVEQCNPAFSRLVNRSGSDLVGLRLSEVLPLKQAENFLASEDYPDIKLRDRTYQTTDYEFRQGSATRILEISGELIELEASASVVLIIRDVTQSRQAAAEHQRTEQEREKFVSLLQATLESTADGILVVTRDRNTPIYNRKFLQLWRMPESLMFPGHADERLQFLSEQTKNPQQFLARVWELFQDRSDEVALELLEFKDGRIFERYSQPLRSGDQIIGRAWSFRDVTEHRRTEAALKQAEERYRSIFENAVVGIYQSTPDGQYLSVNPTLARMHGYESPAEMIAALTDIKQQIYVDPNRRTEFQQILHRQYAITEFEAQVYRKDGSMIWVSENARVVRDADGGILYYEGTSIEITDRQQAEQALRESEERLRLALEAGRMGSWDWNILTGEVKWSDNLEEIHGMPPGSFGGTFDEFLKIVHPQDREKVIQEIAHAIETATDYDIEFRILWADGSTHWILGKGLTIRNNDGQTIRMIGLGMDVTDRKQSEEALSRSELKYRNIFENSHVGIGRTRLGDGMFLEVNQRYAEIMGFSAPSDLVGKRFTDEFYANPADRDRILAEFKTYGEVRNFEEQLLRPDGSIAWGLLSLRANPEEDCLDFVLADISERKRLEEELRQSQQFLNSIIENIPLALFAKDIQDDFRYILINNSSEKILGFSKTGAIGLTDYDLIPKEQADFFRAQDLAAVEQKTLVEVVEQPLPTSQKTILARTLKLPLFDEQGNPTHLLCIAEDITDRKQREEALRLIVEGTASKTGDEFFRACVRYLAKVLRVRYALVSEHGKEVGDQVRTLASWSGDGFIDNFEYCLQDSPCEQVFQGRTCYYPAQLQELFPNDTLLVEIGAESYLGVPLTDSSGQILGHIAVMDTKPMEFDPGRELILKIFAARTGAELERKQAEDALERRAQVDSLLGSISRQFIDQDVNTALDFALEAIARLIGAERGSIFEYSADQSRIHLIQEWHTAGVEPLPHYPDGASVEEFAYLHRQVSRGEVLQIPQVADLPTDTTERRFFESLSVQSAIVVPMIHSDRVVGFLGADVVHYAKTWKQEDVNLLKLVGELIAIGRARHKAESALRIAKDAAEAANRAKSAFLANMSHELRTPLNAILGFSQLMERDAALTPRQRDSLSTINRSGEHLLNLINDVLEMSKIEAGRVVLNPAPFDLHLLLQTLREMFQIRAEAKRLSLQFDLAPDLPQYVLTDEGKLRQVLINLLGNAVKFTQRGGVMLHVRAEGGGDGEEEDGEKGDGEKGDGNIENSPIQTSTLKTQTASSPLTLLFEVEDTGCGIALEEMDRLFEPFVQTVVGTQNRQGTGLGLAISRQFVQLMGGDIYFVSTVDQGSTFYFEIPVTLANPVEVVPPSASRRVLRVAPDQPAYRILVVDDRPENRDLIAQLLNTVGFEVHTATNGQEAIEHWQTWQPHLIWMDMRMPVMSGYEATRRIRARERDRQAAAARDGGTRGQGTEETDSLDASFLIPQSSTSRQNSEFKGQTSFLPTKIIALTASAFEEQRSSILAAGCDDFVGKPFKEQEIFEKMAQHLGVQYVYEEKDNVTEKSNELASSALTLQPSALQAMPPTWIAQLHQAALRVDANLLLQLIKQIPATDPTLAQGLKHLVNHYCFDEILELTQANLE